MRRGTPPPSPRSIQVLEELVEKIGADATEADTLAVSAYSELAIRRLERGEHDQAITCVHAALRWAAVAPRPDALLAIAIEKWENLVNGGDRCLRYEPPT